MTNLDLQYLESTANSANSSLSTNFNVTPYYDDYSIDKDYYRILFKPGFAVQARELTQIQSIIQSQINRFGKHVFKEGSIVIPGNFALHSKNSVIGPTYYVKVKDNDNTNTAVTIANFLDETVTGTTTGIVADINFVLDGTEASGNTKTIYLDYRSVSNSNSSIKTFQAGETLLSENGKTLVVVDTNLIDKYSHFLQFPLHTQWFLQEEALPPNHRAHAARIVPNKEFRRQVRKTSAVNVSENEVQRSQNSDDVWHIHTTQQPRRNGNVVKAC